MGRAASRGGENAMIELNQLRQFEAVAECGTLSAAAERLYISQPALTRSMQKLEKDLGVALFDRAKSKVELNENGRFFLGLVRGMLGDFDSCVERVRAFDRSRKTISVGSCAPAPLWELLPTLSSLYPDKAISSRMKTTDELVADLQNGTAQIIVTNRALHIPGAFGFVLGSEKLLLNVPPAHPLFSHKGGLYFKDIAPYSILLYSLIGDWEEVTSEMLPDTHFIVQEDRENFDSLARLSALPSFATDLSIKHYGTQTDAALIPILDEKATMTYHCYIMNKNKEFFRPFREKFD